MKLHKLGILLITLLIGLSFTSCEEDEWVRSRFDFSTVPGDPEIITNRAIIFDLYDADIEGYNPRRDRIIDMKIYESSLYIFSRNFRPNDILNISIEANTGTYLELNNLYVDGDRVVYIDSRNNAYRNFMYDIINQVIDHGHITLSLYVDSYNSPRMRIDEIEFINDLDLYIRY